MKEWEIRRIIYLKTNPDPGDHILFDDDQPMLQGKRISIIPLSIIVDAENYVNVATKNYLKLPEKDVVYYPLKSYIVAIIYAKLLEKYFDEPFYEALNNPTLLLGDKYFVPYSQSVSVYNSAIEAIEANKLWDFENAEQTHVRQTVDYFKKEFLLV